MLGLRSSGSRPAPSAGAGCVCANGESKKTSSVVKNAPKPSSTLVAYGHDVAQAVARDVGRDARPDREQPDPQQQRALLRGPQRRRAVEQRRRRARGVGDGVVGEVVADERDLEDRDRDGQDHRQRVDRAPARVDPVAPAATGAVERGGDPVERHDAARRRARRARRTPSAAASRRPLGAACTSTGTS